jgi:hypothetical protein
VLYLVARLGTIEQLRPSYLDPVRITWDPIDPVPPAAARMFGDGSWIISQGLENAAGRSPQTD